MVERVETVFRSLKVIQKFRTRGKMMTEHKDAQKEIQELKEQIGTYKQIIESMSVPIISSIIPETVLLPIVGKIFPERFQKIILEISKITKSQYINTVIIDFSGIGEFEIGDLDVFGNSILMLNNTLNLLGIEVLFTGFTPAVSQEIIKSDIQAVKEFKTFLSFRTALQYLMKEKGITFAKE